MNPIVPVIPSGKVALSKDDTTTLLTAVLAQTPLPAGKTAANVRSYKITVTQPAGTATVEIQFNP